MDGLDWVMAWVMVISGWGNGDAQGTKSAWNYSVRLHIRVPHHQSLGLNIGQDSAAVGVKCVEQMFY